MMMLRFMTLVAALTIVASPSVGCAQAAPARPVAKPHAIYADALVNGWENWSWAKTELTVPDADDKSLKPMRVTAGGWEAVAFHKAGFSTAGLGRITFAIRGGAGGQKLGVIPVVAGKPLVERLWEFTVPTGDLWAKVEVPLAEIGIADTVIDGFWLQNRSPAAAAPFLLEDVMLR